MLFWCVLDFICVQFPAKLYALAQSSEYYIILKTCIIFCLRQSYFALSIFQLKTVLHLIRWAPFLECLIIGVSIYYILYIYNLNILEMCFMFVWTNTIMDIVIKLPLVLLIIRWQIKKWFCKYRQHLCISRTHYFDNHHQEKNKIFKNLRSPLLDLEIPNTSFANKIQLTEKQLTLSNRAIFRNHW